MVNGVLEARPKNPYIEMSKLLEAKSMAEIITIRLSALITDTGMAVQALVSTNVGMFEASCGCAPNAADMDDELKDYTIIQDEICNSLLGKNPTDIQKIDQCLQRIEGLDPSVSLAVSMACARAGARHKGVELFEFLGEYSRTTPAIPMPCVSVISRVAGPDDKWNSLSQDVSVIPTTSSSFSGAVEAVIKAYRKSVSVVATNKLSVVPSSSTGCPKIRASLAEILKIAHDAATAEGIMGGLKLVVDMKGCDLASVPPPPEEGAEDNADGEPEAASITYQVGGEPPAVAEKVPEKKGGKGKAAVAEPDPASSPPGTYAMSGAEFVDSFVNSWIDYEMISIEDPALGNDLETLRLLKSVCVPTNHY